MEDGAAELLFELGSEDRLRILGMIEKTPMKLSQIAKSLASTIQETSRQCRRLEEAGLVEKNSDGKYGLTTIGKISILLSPAFALIHGERDYFASHDISSLPVAFVERLGELLEHGMINHLDEALKLQQKIVKESESFVWFMSDQPVGHSLHADHSHFSQRTTLHILLPKSVDTEVFRDAKSSMGSRLQIGLLDEVKIVLAINEKMAAIGLPTLDGRIDYGRGLYGGAGSFQGWCRDLFFYYWGKSIKKYSENLD